MLNECGEKLSADTNAASCFVQQFRGLVEEEELCHHQIFNADETGLYFRMLPRKTLAAHFETSVSGRKKQMERVTLNICANASGSIKLPLQLIAKSAKPRCFKGIDVNSLPVHYCSQKNAWMNCTIFKSWFFGKFVPIVTLRLKELGLPVRAILLLDNCSAHPEESELITEDGCIRATFLPPNVTSLIQPMDQGVIESVKRLYRRRMCEKMLIADEDGATIVGFLKSLNLLDVVHMVAKSWDDIAPGAVQRSWNAIFGKETAPEAPDDSLTCNIVRLFGAMQLSESINATEVTSWLQSDVGVQGHEHLSEEAIIESFHSNAVDDSDQSSDEEEPPTVPHAVAMRAFDTCTLWLRQQNEFTEASYQSLQSLKELAAKKRIDATIQTKIDSFFNRQ